MRRVTRTYWSKRKGQFVTKVYQYKDRSRRSKTLVGKNGRLHKKNIQELIDRIDASSRSEADKITLKSDLRDLVNIRHQNKKKLTEAGFISKVTIDRDDKVKKFFINAGYSPAEFAEEIGEDEDDVLNLDNWRNGELIIGDRRFKFNWTYSGEFYEEY